MAKKKISNYTGAPYLNFEHDDVANTLTIGNCDGNKFIVPISGGGGSGGNANFNLDSQGDHLINLDTQKDYFNFINSGSNSRIEAYIYDGMYILPYLKNDGNLYKNMLDKLIWVDSNNIVGYNFNGTNIQLNTTPGQDNLTYTIDDYTTGTGNINIGTREEDKRIILRSNQHGDYVLSLALSNGTGPALSIFPPDYASILVIDEKLKGFSAGEVKSHGGSLALFDMSTTGHEDAITYDSRNNFVEFTSKDGTRNMYFNTFQNTDGNIEVTNNNGQITINSSIIDSLKNKGNYVGTYIKSGKPADELDYDPANPDPDFNILDTPEINDYIYGVDATNNYTWLFICSSYDQTTNIYKFNKVFQVSSDITGKQDKLTNGVATHYYGVDESSEGKSISGENLPIQEGSTTTIYAGYIDLVSMVQNDIQTNANYGSNTDIRNNNGVIQGKKAAQTSYNNIVDLNAYGKVQDVMVDGVSVIDSNKVAQLTEYVQTKEYYTNNTSDAQVKVIKIGQQCTLMFYNKRTTMPNVDITVGTMPQAGAPGVAIYQCIYAGQVSSRTSVSPRFQVNTNGTIAFVGDQNGQYQNLSSGTYTMTGIIGETL